MNAYQWIRTRTAVLLWAVAVALGFVLGRRRYIDRMPRPR